MVIQKHHLTDEQIEVTQNCGTEPPFSGKLLNEKRNGTYICVVCKDVLFDFSEGSDNERGTKQGPTDMYYNINKSEKELKHKVTSK